MIYLKLVLSALFSGFVVIGGRMMAGDVPLYSAICIRFAIASVLMLLLLWHRKELGLIKQLNNSQWLGLVGAALIGVIIYNLFMLEGLETAPAARAGILFGLFPLLTWIGAWLMLGEKFTKWSFLGSVVCFGGVLFALSQGSLTFLYNLVPGTGDLFLLISLLCWVGFSLITTWLLRSLNPIFVTALTCIIGMIALLPLSILEGFPSVVLDLNSKEWIILIIQGVFSTTLAYLWVCDGIEALGVGKTTLILNVMPLGIVFMAVIILGEPLFIAQIIGAALVCLGVWLAGKTKKQPE